MALVETEGLAVPAGGQVDFLPVENGTLRRAIWGCDSAHAPCRGTVVLASGRTEFIEKYLEVIAELLRRGFAVATFDWRGQGLSSRMLDDRRKGHVDTFETFDQDFRTFMAAPEMAVLPKPFIGLGHSMGGNLMLRGAYNMPGQFEAVVLSAPMLGIRLGSPLLARITRWLVNSMVLLGLGGRYVPGTDGHAADEQPFEENSVTSDPARYEMQQKLIAANPDLGLGGPTANWVHKALKSIDQMSDLSYLANVRVPVLVCEAENDALVEGESLRHAAQHLPHGEYLEIPGSQHEILMEQDPIRTVFWRGFDRFVDAVMVAPASADAG